MLTTLPMQIQPALRLVFKIAQCHAVDRMHHNPEPTIGDANNALARQRLTAGRAVKMLIWRQANHLTTAIDLIRSVGRHIWIDRVHQFIGGQFGAAHQIKQLMRVFDTQMTGRGFQHLISNFLADLLKSRACQFLAQFNIPTAISLTQRPADSGFRLTGNRNIQPGRLRNLTLCRYNFNRLAIFKSGPQRHPQTIDFGAHAGTANSGMNGIGVIKRCGAPRQFDHVPFGSEAKYLIGIHLKFDCLEKLLVILIGVKLLRQRTNPSCRVNRKGVTAAHTVTIRPMCGHTRFGNIMHLASADLHLDTFAVASRNCGMDTAIPV